MPTWLRNAKIDEVSLVPKGANRRRFTVFKAQHGHFKTEDGVEFPADAFAHVPDPTKPSTWKLRLWETPEKKVTAPQVGRAVAALGPGGFRGNRVQIPAADLPGVKAKVRRAWKQVHPDAGAGDVPSAIKSQEGNMPDPKDLKELIASVADMDDEAKAELRKALELQPENVFDKLTAATDEQKDALRKALGMEPETDDSLKARVMKLFGLTPTALVPNPDVPEAVRKAIDDVKGEVKKAEERADKADKRADKAEELIAKRDREARVQTMVVKAAKYGSMGSADDLSKLLSDIDEKLGEEGLKTVEAILAKGEEGLKQAQTFAEIGVVPRGEMHDNALSEIDAKAAEIMKSDSNVKTIEEARGRAWKENPKLYKQYQSERRRQLKNAEEED
jgi:hypothetical protein